MPGQIKLAPIADLRPFLEEGNLVALSAGPDNQLYAAVALEPLDYRMVGAGGAIFPKIRPDRPQTYRILALQDGEPTLDLRIEKEKLNIHFVQPLPDGRLLLACARWNTGGKSDPDKNGRIYSSSGIPVGEIVLGDAIQALQSTSTGAIWTSYFDEGTLASGHIGKSGLVAWDVEGNKTYEYEPDLGLDYIVDCYAMNAASERDIWVYYYTEFPLVHIQDRKIKAAWDIPVEGCHAFAVSDGLALFSGDYDDKDLYTLVELGPAKQVKQTHQFQFCDENGRPLSTGNVFARSESLYLEQEGRVYRADTHTVRNAV